MSFLSKIRNFFYYGWKFRENYDWDFSYLYEMIILKIRDMRNHLELEGNTVKCSDKRFLKQMTIAANCLERLRNDDYCDGPHFRHRKRKPVYNKIFNVWLFEYPPGYFQHEENLRKQDMEMFCKIFTKYSRHWWN